ncbi:xanthine dehydrogenase family protein molybdopterin-binding subunit [Rhodococcus sp. NPDC057529]|uniref:xanthine dehydrogenase family protein molybdopterin-binding subunit n=1 Tax=Rhodococcus sp. NPDC057529 TaxID=3346158 RepID=UPI00367119EE
MSRLEDGKLLTGSGTYTADLQAARPLHAVFVRSKVARGLLRGVDTAAATAAPGVAAVVTADDLELPRLAPAQAVQPVDIAAHRPLLAAGAVRFVGEVVAVVVAASAREARNAAAMVSIDVVELPPVLAVAEAVRGDSSHVIEELHTNIARSSRLAEVKADLPDVRPDVTVHTRVEQPRMGVMPMETSAIVAVPHQDGSFDVVLSSQMPHRFRRFASAFLGIPIDLLRVRCPAVGGGFGGKTPFDPDYLLVLALARHLDLPVRWVQTRHENLLTMQGRGHTFDATATADRTGRISSLSVNATTDVGAYPGTGMVMIHTARSLATGVYTIRELNYDIRCVTTNTAPTGAFRGAGRPEATHLIERVMDEVAVRLDLDPVEVRRRNLVAASSFPWTNPAGETYDSGDYEAALDLALGAVGYDRLREEQRTRSSDSTTLLGIGISCYVEVSASAGVGLAKETAQVRVLTDGTIELRVGTAAHGQGHWTLYSQVASPVLKLPLERFVLADPDTSLTEFGEGTGGSRSAQIGGSAVQLAAQDLVARATALVARTIGVTQDEVELREDGAFAASSGHSFTWEELATIAESTELIGEATFDQVQGSAPFGCHIAVVEVERDTGRVSIRDFVAVDDCGVVINPLIVTGQIQGGVAAGIAEALFEEIRYDSDGALETESLAEYLMPSAADLPSVQTLHTTTPTRLNPLGAKGVGESGTTGSVAAVHNAVEDALRRAGAGSVQIPLTPGRVWAALHTTAASSSH